MQNILQNNEWQSIQAKPKANAQAWLHRHVPEHVADKVFDMWAFQQESMKGGGKPVITGLLRIERSAAKALLGLLRQKYLVCGAFAMEQLRD